MPVVAGGLARAALPHHHPCNQSQRHQKRGDSRNNWIPSRPTPRARRRRKGPRCDRLPFQPAFKVFGKIARRAITRTWFPLQTFRADRFQIPIQPGTKCAASAPVSRSLAGSPSARAHPKMADDPSANRTKSHPNYKHRPQDQVCPNRGLLDPLARVPRNQARQN